ncbi:hypothetical protein ACV3SJ_004660 [Pseudomonas aeruginosa]
MRSWRDWSWADGNFWDSGVQPRTAAGAFVSEQWSLATLVLAVFFILFLRAALQAFRKRP